MNLGRVHCSVLGATLGTAILAATLRASEAPAPAPKTAVSASPGGRGAGLPPPLPYAPARVPSAHTIRGTSAQSRVGDADEDKQRVPKQPDESRRKPEPGVTPQTTESSGGESSCVGSCIGSFFESLFSSDSKTPPEPPPPSIAPTGMAWLPGARGEINSDTSIPIWDGPGGPGANRNQVGMLSARTRVTVLESNTSIEGLWLKVQPSSLDGPVGWMDSGYIGPLTEPVVPPVVEVIPPERFSVWLGVGGGIVGPGELDQEYTDGGFRIEGQVLWPLAGSWQLGGGVGYRNFQGTPQVLYATPSVTEEPTNSTLQFMDVGVRGGQRFGTGSHGLRFTWLVGAGTVLVDEKADVVVYSASSGQEISRREDSLARWRFGGDLRLALAWPVSSNIDVGVLFGGWVVDWQGEEKLSLTTDFLMEPIYGFDAALCVSFGGR